jgi:hypothetical protein
MNCINTHTHIYGFFNNAFRSSNYLAPNGYQFTPSQSLSPRFILILLSFYTSLPERNEVVGNTCFLILKGRL